MELDVRIGSSTSETLLPDRQRGIPEGVPVLVLDMEQQLCKVRGIEDMVGDP